MSRSLLLFVAGSSVVLACAKPEPEPTAGAGSAQPSVQAPELEQVEYVDPLEEARAAAKRATPADESWREGFDHRDSEGAAPSDSNAAEPSPSAATGSLQEEFAAGGSEATGPSLPTLPPPPKSDGRVPQIDPSLSPRDPAAAAQRPPDAQPPPR
jgi:hypothetical protein